jgi:hypothetical protein
MRKRGVAPGALAWASVAVLAVAGALGAGCELAVGDAIPPFGCVEGTDTCPADAICSKLTKMCVALSTTCIGTGCQPGSTCDTTSLACVSADAATPIADGAASFADESASDASSPDDDAGTLDAAMRLDAGDADATISSSDGDDATTPDTGDDATLDATDAAVDATAPDATPPNDAATAPGDGALDGGAGDGGAGDGGGACAGLLCSCSGAAQCTSGICADESTVTTPLYTQAGSASFCTQSCCSSADCGPSTVCFGTGAGGNYCVDPAWLSRSSTLGTLAGGATCAGNADCRSGLCASGACVDTCCSTAQVSAACVSGATCNLGTFPGLGSFDTHRTGFCNASVAACGLSPCAACRTSSDCSVIDQVCSYSAAAVGSTDIVATCEPVTTGAGAQGAACTSGSACASGYCDTVSSPSGQCSDVCFTDADCKAGWGCRTELVSIETGGGNYYVLRCGD